MIAPNQSAVSPSRAQLAQYHKSINSCFLSEKFVIEEQILPSLTQDRFAPQDDITVLGRCHPDDQREEGSACNSGSLILASDYV